MNLCSKCLVKAGIKVLQPQILRPMGLCDGCWNARKSYNVIDIIEQLLKDDK